MERQAPPIHARPRLSLRNCCQFNRGILKNGVASSATVYVKKCTIESIGTYPNIYRRSEYACSHDKFIWNLLLHLQRRCHGKEVAIFIQPGVMLDEIVTLIDEI